MARRRSKLIGLIVIAAAVACWWKRQAARRPDGADDEAAAPAPEPVPEAPIETAETVETADEVPAPTWVAADDGACPDDHPVKVNDRSGIYHVPGGLSYERTRPTRCYRDAASAEADGFRRAKR